MRKHWRIRPFDVGIIARLEAATGYPPVVAQLLAARGFVDPAVATRFLDAPLSDLRDPEELPGLSAAADRITAAVSQRRKIVVYGDYDADGMTATAILYRCLNLLGADVRYHIPCRLEDGYGLHHEALERLAEAGASMVISVDCGIASTQQAETARRLGLELIITDHHELGERLPDADAIVHPRLPGSDYAFGSLCGAGVAFKLAWALCQRGCGAKKVTAPLRSFLLTAISLAAIGTVADVVPLVDENRLLVRHGLASLKSCPPVGLRQLMRAVGLEQKSQLDAEDIAFAIAPRLNAAGRLGQAQLGVELLTTDSDARAASLAGYLNELNEQRLSLERSIYLAAVKQIKQRYDPASDSALVLAGHGWHAGIIGIVAGRLAEKYHLPVVLVALDQLGVRPGIGSARSVPGLNLHQALTDCRGFLITHGGHAAAAGLRIDEGQLDEFRSHFCQRVARAKQADGGETELVIDAQTTLAQLTLKTVRQIELLAPFGQENPRPILVASEVAMAEPPRCIGQGERHLAMTVEQYGIRMRAMAFHRAEWSDELASCAGPVDIACRPVINEFRGRRSVEVHLVDWRPSAESPQPPHLLVGKGVEG